MKYKIIAHHYPEGIPGPHSGSRPVPALIASQAGTVGLVHSGQRTFQAMPPEIGRQHIQEVLGQSHKWRRFPGAHQPDWRDGGQVMVTPSGDTYVNYDEAEGSDIVDPPLADGDGPPNNAPRQDGKIETIVGNATNDGIAFKFGLQLTKCGTCANYQSPLLQIKPCNREFSEINWADFGYYSNNGGCPFYSFGMTVPEPDPDELAESGPALNADMVRGALIKLVGGKVTGPVADTVELTDTPTRVVGFVEVDNLDEDDTTGDAKAQLSDGSEEPNDMNSNVNAIYPQGLNTKWIDLERPGNVENENTASPAITMNDYTMHTYLSEWYDRQTDGRNTLDEMNERLFAKVDTMNLHDRNIVLDKIYKSVERGNTLEAALAENTDEIYAAQDEDLTDMEV